MPITPSGTLTRLIFNPLGRSQVLKTVPTGSGSCAIISRPEAILSNLVSSSINRSRSAAVNFLSRAKLRSETLAFIMALELDRTSEAASNSALSFAAFGALFNS